MMHFRPAVFGVLTRPGPLACAWAWCDTAPTVVPHPVAGNARYANAGFVGSSPLDTCSKEADAVARSIAEFLGERSGNRQPAMAIVCGSGPGVLRHDLDDPLVIPSAEIPHYPLSTVEGHEGNVVFGRLNGVEVVLLQGRVHMYEGYTAEEVTRAVRAFKRMGVRTLLLTSAVGAINQNYEVGDVVCLTDHHAPSFLTGGAASPMVGANDYGPRFVDMRAVYSARIGRMAVELAAAEGVAMHRGVLNFAVGPCFETPAEVRALRTLGCDVAGMSVANEAAVAVHDGLEVAAFSIVSNLCVDTPIDREEGAASQEQEDEEHAAVLEAVQKKGVPNLRGVLTKLVAKLQ